MYTLKISAIGNIKISITTTAKITDRNVGMQNVLDCHITSIRKMSAKLGKKFCRIFVKQFLWTLDVEKFRTIMLNIAKTQILLVKKRNLSCFK